MGALTGFPSRLLRLRAEAQMTQKELAKASGISVPQIARYETGSSKPRMTALVKLAKALNVEVSSLEDAHDEPENMEIVLATTDGVKRSHLAVSREIYERISDKADELGVSFEVAFIALFEMAFNEKIGKTVDFQQVIEEVAAEQARLHPKA